MQNGREQVFEYQEWDPQETSKEGTTDGSLEVGKDRAVTESKQTPTAPRGCELAVRWEAVGSCGLLVTCPQMGAKLSPGGGAERGTRRQERGPSVLVLAQTSQIRPGKQVPVLGVPGGPATVQSATGPEVILKPGGTTLQPGLVLIGIDWQKLQDPRVPIAAALRPPSSLVNLAWTRARLRPASVVRDLFSCCGDASVF